MKQKNYKDVNSSTYNELRYLLLARDKERNKAQITAGYINIVNTTFYKLNNHFWKILYFLL